MEQDPCANLISCQWCSKQISSDVIRCSGCGKLRKDIYTDKLRSYLFCITGGLLIAASIVFWERTGGYDYDYNYNYSISADNTLNYILLAVGIVAAIAGIVYYVRTSQKLKRYWWI